MTLKEAIVIVKEEGLKPIHAYESERYFVFFVVSNSGEAIGNNCSYVVDKTEGSGRWVPQSAFPLPDAGEFVNEYDI